KVAVHRDDHRAGGCVESGGQRRSLPVIAGEVDDRDARIAFGDVGDRFPRPVRAPVVDVDDLGIETEQKEHGGQAPMQLVECAHFVEERYDDRQVANVTVSRITRHGEVSWRMSCERATGRGERAGSPRPTRRISRAGTRAAGLPWAGT